MFTVHVTLGSEEADAYAETSDLYYGQIQGHGQDGPGSCSQHDNQYKLERLEDSTESEESSDDSSSSDEESFSSEENSPKKKKRNKIKKIKFKKDKRKRKEKDRTKRANNIDDVLKCYQRLLKHTKKGLTMTGAFQKEKVSRNAVAQLAPIA
ncbi:hypothetical protein AOLI_G00024370 [Acnodon oligacanthus]